MKIEISNELFKRLQNIAEPFIDTPESIINRALDALENRSKSHVTKPPSKPISATTFLDTYTDLKQLPSLKHTKILDARIGEQIITGTWAESFSSTLKIAAKILNSPSEVIPLSRANIQTGRGDKEKGFEYIPEIGLSFQRCDADVTFRHIYDLVRELDLYLKIKICWSNNPKAAFPDRSANIVIKPLSEGFE